ncbi:anti-sigma factor [Paraburkholderia phymatum]|uniref:Anti-sigma factor n=1 Tax=Paraburkholderia phymatum TaxID=148447 RepID=A0ACC6TS63_9BURK
MSLTHSPTDTPLTEADMQAFADGNLPPERAARVRKYLGLRPREAERIAFYRHLNMQMRDVFEGAFAQRIRASRADRAQTANFRSRARRFFLQRVGVALLGVALLVASVSGWFFASRVSTEMLEATAVMALMRASVQRSGGAAVAVPNDPHAADLAPLGLKLVDVRTRRPNAFAHIDILDYRNADGDAVVLVSSWAPFAADKPHWFAQRVGDVRLLMWTADGKRYVLAGRATTHGLMRAADALTMRQQNVE